MTARYWYVEDGQLVRMEWRPMTDEDKPIPPEEAPAEEPDEPEEDIEVPADDPKTDEVEA